ncbi:MAG: NADH-quinone oxidoreductase subunit NuoG [Gammaproteobacteria bacterium]|nr:NADH-quinone oxidoreductase subunit NuoG [Gammaproteobacteria bacterium]
MITLNIDGRDYPAREGDNLLQACLSLGLDLPYFCWHPALGSVGACRQCAITRYEDADDTHGQVVMACMTPVQAGTRVSLQDPQARRFRAGIIELLMLNHPHDCPVCEEGGECHLQDMTVMTGHAWRRTRFAKRSFHNQDLGPCVGHEMNRCITCYRCVRFYRDYAGGTDLHALGTHDRVYFGRERDGTLRSEFSGNLAEVCPTGVFTDKPFARHYTRKWDLRATPSVCVHCAHGCNISINGRYETLRRTVNRYNDAVNGYFLCDRGRYGNEFVNAEHRPQWPLQRNLGGWTTTTLSRHEALEAISGPLARALELDRVIGIGSSRAGVESNFALRTLVGAERFHAGVAANEHLLLRRIQEVLRRGPVATPSRREVEAADAVLVLGEDVSSTAPRLALSLRQSARNAALGRAGQLGLPAWQAASVQDATAGIHSPFAIVTTDTTRLDELATTVRRAAPIDIARFAATIAHELDPGAPAVGLPDDAHALAAQLAQTLAGAERPLVVCGSGCGEIAVVEAAANVARALHRHQPEARLACVLAECNSLGLALMDPLPLASALEAMRKSEADMLIVLENDLYRRARSDEVDRALDSTSRVIVIDHQRNATGERAGMLLPASTFAESEGTLVSAEGRAQRYFPLLEPAGAVQASWQWLEALRSASVAPAAERVDTGGRRFDELTEACARSIPALGGITSAAPDASYRLHGRRVPREPQRASGRTAMHADRDVHDPEPPVDPDSPLAYTMEGSHRQPPTPLTPFVWTPRWNSVQALNKFQNEVGGAMQGGPAGCRLIEPASTSHPYFQAPTSAFLPEPGRWLLVPGFDVFTGEELSAQSAPLRARSRAPHVAVNRAAAAHLRCEDGQSVEIVLAQGCVTLPLRIHPALPDGVASVLIAGTRPPIPELPALARIRPSDDRARHGTGR